MFSDLGLALRSSQSLRFHVSSNKDNRWEMTESGIVDLIVVGAGLAGLVAARDAHHAGLSVCLLEAHDQVGGRIYSKSTDAGIEELGAEFVTPHLHTNVIEEIDRYGLNLFPVGADDPELWIEASDDKRRTVLDEETLARVAKHIDTSTACIDRDQLIHNGCVQFDIPWRDYLATIPATDDAIQEINALSFALSGACADDVSALSLLRDIFFFGGALKALFEGGEYRVAGGTQSIATAIANTLESQLVLEARVDTIAETNDGVDVIAGQNAYRARAAIVAVPFNVLSRIDFTPSLSPDIIHGSERGHACRARKTWFNCNKSDRSFYVQNAPTAVSFVGSNPSDCRRCVIEAGDVAPRTSPQDFLQFGSEHPLDLNAHDWNADKRFRGGWMTPRPGQLQLVETLRRASGRVRFAGSDLTSVWPGWMEGAVHSGHDTVRQLRVYLAT